MPAVDGAVPLRLNGVATERAAISAESLMPWDVGAAGWPS
jgi:hypothetical protein